jgi:hypothetical protein
MLLQVLCVCLVEHTQWFIIIIYSPFPDAGIQRLAATRTGRAPLRLHCCSANSTAISRQLAKLGRVPYMRHASSPHVRSVSVSLYMLIVAGSCLQPVGETHCRDCVLAGITYKAGLFLTGLVLQYAFRAKSFVVCFVTVMACVCHFDALQAAPSDSSVICR